MPRRLSDYDSFPVGKHTYGDPEIIEWGEGASLSIGAFCSIAEGVAIFLGGNHRLDWVTTYPFNYLWECGAGFQGHPATKGDVVIGNDVWIGRNAVILSGVHIGDGAAIGTEAVVTKDVPPYALAVGNPARLVKLRFDTESIHQLLKIRWWEWPDERICQALPLLLNNDLLGFLKAAADSVLFSSEKFSTNWSRDIDKEPL